MILYGEALDTFSHPFFICPLLGASLKASY